MELLQAFQVKLLRVIRLELPEGFSMDLMQVHNSKETFVDDCDGILRGFFVELHDQSSVEFMQELSMELIVEFPLELL